MNMLIEKTGYLNDDFKLFHLKNKENSQFEYHNHDFNKIIIFISGDVNYIVRDKTYTLEHGDIVFVNSNEAHKPIINNDEDYERIVIWINPEFIFNHQYNEENLFKCFEIANKNKHNVLRLKLSELNEIKCLIERIKENDKNNKFGNGILGNAIFLQLMVAINRIYINKEKDKNIEYLRYDKTIEDIIEYINLNLNKSISIDDISEEFFLSKHHLMRKFKSATGDSIHNYIIKKKLILAKEYMKQGLLMRDICYKCGFNDYSTFVRSFKKIYGVSPKQYISYNMKSDILNI